jgi:uncharacterized protein DUF4440
MSEMTGNINRSESSGTPIGNADTLRATEASRLRALVDRDMETAERLHAEDFQLITPGGAALSKSEYLNGVASGLTNYRVWEVDSHIDVRLFNGVAILRYRSILHMIYHGDDLGPDKFWHTDSYEWREGRWQVVWSHATRIR